MHCAKLMDKIRKELEFVCSEGNTSEEVEQNEAENEVEKFYSGFGFQPFTSILGRVNDMRENYPVKQYVSSRQWVQQRFISKDMLRTLNR